MNLVFLGSETQISHGISRDQKPLGDYDFEKDNLKGSEPTKATQSFTLTQTSSTTVSTETGFSLSVMGGIEVCAETSFFGTGVSNTYKFELTTEFSMSSGYEKTQEKSYTYHYMVEVPVPAKSKVFINFFKSEYTLMTKWRANFRATGTAFVTRESEYKYLREEEKKRNLINLISYDERKIYSFGSMSFPRKKIIAVSKAVDRDGNLLAKEAEEPVDEVESDTKKKTKSLAMGTF